MSTKKDNALPPVVGFSSIIELGSVDNVTLDIMPSTKVEPGVDLHMQEVSKNPLRPPLDLW